MTLSATNMSEKRPLMVYFSVKFIVNVTRDLVTVNLTVNKVFLKDYYGLVKHGKMLNSTCRNILRDFGSIFLNDVCSPKTSWKGKSFRDEKRTLFKNTMHLSVQQMSSSRSIYGMNKLIVKCEIITWVSWSRCVVVCWSPLMKLTPK